MKRTHPVPLASVLDYIVDSRHMRSRMNERRAVALWPRVVGEAMATKASALEASDGCLRLHCTNSVLRQEIMFNSNSLLGALNEMVGTTVIKEIIFV